MILKVWSYSSSPLPKETVAVGCLVGVGYFMTLFTPFAASRVAYKILV